MAKNKKKKGSKIPIGDRSELLFDRVRRRQSFERRLKQYGQRYGQQGRGR